MSRQFPSRPLSAQEKEDRAFFWIILGMLVLFFSGRGIIGLLSSAPLFRSGCPFHAMTGLYCPGCGGTRALAALIKAKPAESFMLHPLVPYLAGLTGLFMISQLLSVVSGNRIRGLHIRKGFFAAAAVLTIVNWLWKNAALIFFGMDLLAGS